MRKRKYYIVKHDLESLQRFPGLIWRSDVPKTEKPHRFDEVQIGDRWVAYAFTNDEQQEQSLSHVTGFYECTARRRYDKVPDKQEEYAWQIQGQEYQEQPIEPVDIEAIDEVLGRRTFWNQAIVPITQADFERIREKVLETAFDATTLCST